jgi:hypothetical protein
LLDFSRMPLATPLESAPPPFDERPHYKPLDAHQKN